MIAKIKPKTINIITNQSFWFKNAFTKILIVKAKLNSPKNVFQIFICVLYVDTVFFASFFVLDVVATMILNTITYITTAPKMKYVNKSCLKSFIRYVAVEIP